MARFKKARWVGEKSPRRRMSKVDIVCVHTIAGRAPAHQAHFSVYGGGDIDQSRDTKYRSAANLDGNPRIIAIENEDHGPCFADWDGSDVPALTEEQINANAEILAWAHIEHGVPLQLCPDSKPGSRGLGYHRQGIDGNFETDQHPFPGRVAGGEVWTLAKGKVCPGDRRIAQLPEILRRAKIIVAGEQEQEMARDARIHQKLAQANTLAGEALNDIKAMHGSRRGYKMQTTKLWLAILALRAVKAALPPDPNKRKK